MPDYVGGLSSNHKYPYEREAERDLKPKRRKHRCIDEKAA